MSTSPVASLVRVWVELYTRGLPDQLRSARRDEIDDDLWCQFHEAAADGRSAQSLGTELFLRLLLGVPADLSWRLSHGGVAGAGDLKRRPSMSTRVIGLLAALAGASWAMAATLVVVVGPSVADEMDDFTGLYLGFGGLLAFAAAISGLVWRFHDHLTSLGLIGGVLAALAVVVGPITAVFPLVLPMPIGSALLVRDLARAGVLSRPLAIAHALGALSIIVPLLAILIGTRWTENTVIAVLGLPYFLSWVAIGASLLLRGSPRAHVGPTG